MQNVLGVMFAVGVPQVPILLRDIPAPEFPLRVIVLPSMEGGVGQVVGASVIPAMVSVVPNVTTKLLNCIPPLTQPLPGDITDIADNACPGAAGHGVTPMDAHAGAANASGIATLKNRLNIRMFLIWLRILRTFLRTSAPRAEFCGLQNYTPRSVLHNLYDLQ
jgi:hypothetical protein